MKRVRILNLVAIFILAVVIAAVGIIPEYASAKTKYSKKISVKLTDGQDATQAIQNALDEAAKAGTKKKPALVSVPAGTYYLSRTLVIGSNTCLSLDKKTVMKKSTKVKDPISYMLRSKAGTKGGYSDTANITVMGGTWDAEYIVYNETSGGSLFFFAHTTNLKITDVTLCHNFGTHLIEMGGVKKCTIKNCKLYGFKAPKEDAEKEAIQLDICHNNNILPAGDPFDDTPCTDITVTGCEIHDYPRAIGSHMKVKGIFHDKITITKNKMYNISAAAIYGYNYTNVTIKDNTMTNVRSGVQIKTDATKAKKTILERLDGVKAMSVAKGNYNIKVVNNKISLTNKDDEEEGGDGVEKDSGGVGVFIFGSEENTMKGITITNNEMICNSSGVYLRYVNDATVSNNTIDRNIGAVPAESTKGTAEDALKLRSCNNAVLDGNKISTIHADMYENGIAMREGCKDATVSNNTIEGTTKTGIALYDASSIIGGTDNIIENAGKHGIVASGSEICLTGGSVNGAEEHGVSILSGGKVILKDCTISGTKQRGINVKDKGTLEATNVKVYGSGGKGIDIAENCKAALTDCEIADPADYGIDIDKNSDVTMTGCIVSNSKDNGINIRSNVTARLTKCTIVDSAARGVDIKPGSNVTMESCYVNGSNGRGVDIAENTSVELNNCTFSKNGANAVNIDGVGASVTVEGCHILDNGGEGLHLKNGIVTINANEIKNNCLTESDGKAIAVFSGITGSITNNTLSNPMAKSEIKVFDGARLSPAIDTAKREKVVGTTDNGGNRFE